MNDLEANRLLIEDIDKQMALLFEKRLLCVSKIGKYKKENNIPVFDLEREKKLIEKNSQYVKPEFKDLYEEFLINIMDLSKKYQKKM